MKKIIYKVTNKTDGRTYIGASTKGLEPRKQDHINKAYSNSELPLHQAISTYGEDAFTWETIDTASNTNELAEKEVNYIYELKQETQLYNADRGGGIPKEVYQYDANNFNLIAKYDNLKEASSTIGSTKKALSKTCLSVNQYLGGYYWSYNCSAVYTPNTDKRKKQVYQFTLEGEFLKAFKSVADANRQTGVNKTSIAKVCRNERKSAGNYFWKYI